MSNHSACPKCDFQFTCCHNMYSTTDNPEYQGVFWVLCKECLEEFHVPTRLPRGVSCSEQLELCRIEQYPITAASPRTRYVGTGVTVLAAAEPKPLDEMASFAEGFCPSCNSACSLVLSLPAVECPKCHEALLELSAFE